MRRGSRRFIAPKFLVASLLALGVAALAHAAFAQTLTSRLLIDPAGENDGDTFGCSVAPAGDLNGDGYDDLIIGANFYPGLAGRGRAYIYFGGPSIDSVADLVLPNPLPTGNHFGISVASAGDFNGDGYPDVIVGMRYAGLPGKAFIYYGGPAMDATPDVTLTGESTGASTWFGFSVAPAGDVNGDGYDDVIVGSPMCKNATGYVGRAYVFFGGSAPDAVPDRVFTGGADGDDLGWTVGSAGDLNGDGHPDLFAIAPYNDAGGTDAGAAYVWFGGPGFDTVPDLTITGFAAGEHLMRAAAGGDLNADGYSDLIVSDDHRVRVYFGGPTPNAVADLTLLRSAASIAGAGDVNGDSADDFVIGDPTDDTAGADAGRVSVYFGGSALDTVEDMYFLGDRPARLLGRAVAAAGHIDGPGPADLVAAASEDPEGIGYDSGRVYVYANAFGTTAVPVANESRFEFSGPEPNPASGAIRFSLALDQGAAVRVAVYDLAGHEVARPIADEWLAGRVTRSWRPDGLESGIYWVSAQLGARREVRKLVWLGGKR
jgi:hypothetical protein